MASDPLIVPDAVLTMVLLPVSDSRKMALVAFAAETVPLLTIRLSVPIELIASASNCIPLAVTCAPASMVSLLPELNSIVLAPVP